MLIEHVQTRLTYPLLLTLTAAPDVQPFHKRLGWLRQTTAMIHPRSRLQAALNCPPEEACGPEDGLLPAPGVSVAAMSTVEAAASEQAQNDLERSPRTGLNRRDSPVTWNALLGESNALLAISSALV